MDEQPRDNGTTGPEGPARSRGESTERTEHKQQIDRIVEQLQAEPGDGYVFA